MSIFSHSDILACLEGNLSDPKWHAAIGARLLPPEKQGEADIEHLIGWLRRLPNYTTTAEIGTVLAQLAEAHDATLFNLQWWDIDARKRHVLCDVRRGGREPAVRMLFMWKKTEDAKEHGPTARLLHSRSWVRDAQAPRGWRYELEGETIQQLSEVFASWLNAPLPPLPDGTRFHEP